MKCNSTSFKLVLAFLVSFGSSHAADPEDADGALSAERNAPLAAVKTKRHDVVLSAEQIRLSGLASLIPKVVVRHQEYTCFGRVVNIQSLLDLRVRHREAKANLDIQTANLSLSEKNRIRIRALVEAKVVPSRDLLQAETQWQADQARKEAARLQEQSIRHEALYHWGQPLSELALQEDIKPLESYLQHHQSILEITLPKGKSLDEEHAQIRIGRHFDRSLSTPAKLISPAPHSDELLQGESWFFSVAGDALRAGMRIHAWVTDADIIQGVEIPASAVIWQGGHAWIYLEPAPGHFERFPVEQTLNAGNHMFIVSGVDSGIPVVTIGAQTLLAEEFRHRIPSEDEDKE